MFVNVNFGRRDGLLEDEELLDIIRKKVASNDYWTSEARLMHSSPPCFSFYVHGDLEPRIKRSAMVFIKELIKFSEKVAPLFLNDSIFANDQYDYTFNGVLDYDKDRDDKENQENEEDQEDEEDEEDEDENENDPEDEKFGQGEVDSAAWIR
ncbi:hypothetical protein N7466_008412 [Penicillium verhagenii]|uniref:uncharacterized protein n=1 Tax=Penicillium verhagenii TaxID=1562060 RepID=UPI0025458178|nr:uncharacterized protein N7466_008412 [Penicillium verhagenii]KAJ5924225.1 hypothetical protein N7466_008412 [Penicillium verhagenii]